MYPKIIHQKYIMPLITGQERIDSIFFHLPPLPSPMLDTLRPSSYNETKNQKVVRVMSSYFGWFGLPGTFVLTVLMSLLALTLALLRPSRHRWLCFSAMALSSIGDLFMTNFGNLRNLFPNTFVIGAVFFMAAHVMYFFTYRALLKRKRFRFFNPAVVCSLIIGALLLAYFTYQCSRLSDFELYPLCVIYLVFIIAGCAMMFSYSWSSFKSRPLSIFAAIGALSFLISDAIIGLDFLAGITQYGHLIWWFYPIGQILIVSSAD